MGSQIRKFTMLVMSTLLAQANSTLQLHPCLHNNDVTDRQDVNISISLSMEETYFSFNAIK